MAYTRTTWADRLVQFPNRFSKSNETTTSVTLSADPGTVTNAGTALSATNLNKMEDGIELANNNSIGSIVYAYRNFGGAL